MDGDVQRGGLRRGRRVRARTVLLDENGFVRLCADDVTGYQVKLSDLCRNDDVRV